MPGFVANFLGRSDYAIIGEIDRAEDAGCSTSAAAKANCWRGSAENKGVDARGVEIAGAKVQKAIARGVSVYQGDIDEGLARLSRSGVRLRDPSQTLQETRYPRQVLREMLRVGKPPIVAFPNFGHWSVRLAHLPQRTLHLKPSRSRMPLVRFAQLYFPDGG